MSYVPFHADWHDSPATDTPITAAFLEYLEAGLVAAALKGDLAIPAPAGLGANEVLVWTGTVWDAIKLTTANLAAAAGITRAQLSGVFPIDNADVDPSAAIARSKLNFGAGLVNADIAAAAAIAYSKLSLGNSIVNADIAAAAAIAVAKMAAGSNGAILKTAGGSSAWTNTLGSGQLIYGTGSDIAFTATPADKDHLMSVSGVPTWMKAPIRAISVSGVAATIANSSSMDSLYAITVPGNSLGANGQLEVVIHGLWTVNAGAGATDLTFRVRFGGVSYWNDIRLDFPASAAQGIWEIRVVIQNMNSTGSSRAYGHISMGDRTAPTTGLGALGTNDLFFNLLSSDSAQSVDTTADQDFDLSVQWSTANINQSIARHSARAVILS